LKYSNYIRIVVYILNPPSPADIDPICVRWEPVWSGNGGTQKIPEVSSASCTAIETRPTRRTTSFPEPALSSWIRIVDTSQPSATVKPAFHCRQRNREIQSVTVDDSFDFLLGVFNFAYQLRHFHNSKSISNSRRRRGLRSTLVGTSYFLFLKIIEFEMNTISQNHTCEFILLHVSLTSPLAYG
jgi:hypothetical protein